MTRTGTPSASDDLAARAIGLVEADPPRARRIAEEAVGAARSTGDPAATSRALRALGLATWELGDVAAAAGVLRQAVAAGRQDGPVGELRAAEARRTLCWVLSDLGDTRGALREAALAAAHFRGRELAILLTQRAWVLQRAGRYDEALADYRRARALLRRERSPLHEARLLGNRSLLFVQQGRLVAAEADLRRAERLFGELGLEAAVAKSRHNLGCVAARRGDVPRALMLYDAAEEAYAGLQMPRALGMLDYHRAELLLSVRLVPEARRVGERAVRRLGAAGAQAERAEALLMLSKAAFLAGDWALAESRALEAQRAFARQRRSVWRAEATLAGARARWGAGDRSPATLRRARRAGGELLAAGFPAPALEAALIAGHAALAGGRSRIAAAELGRASRARRSGSAELRARAWHAEAQLRAGRGDLRGARRALGAGLNAVERARASLGATELRAHVGAQGEPLMRLGLRLALQGGRPAAVLGWAERWRAGRVWFRPVRPPQDARLAADLDELRAVSGRIGDAAVAGRDPAALVRRQAELEEAVRRRSRHAPGRLGEARMAAPPGPAELARALGARALVELVESDGRLWAVTVTAAGARLRELGPAAGPLAEQRALGFALRRLALGRGGVPLLAAAARSAEHAAARLDEMVLGPLRREVGDRALVVVPTAELHAIPWGALPSCHGRPVTVAPSAALWRRARDAPRSPAGRVVLVSGPGLDGAADEVARLGARYPGGLRLSGGDAGARAVAAAMDGAALVHVAAHGSFRADNPLFSSLRLADGALTVHELERLERAPRLLVLSACESALLGVGGGDGLLGLSTAMLALGTSTLVAGAGLLDDAVARDVMLGFHDRLRAGQEPAEALAAAQAVGGGGPEGLAARAGFLCLGAG